MEPESRTNLLKLLGYSKEELQKKVSDLPAMQYFYLTEGLSRKWQVAPGSLVGDGLGTGEE